MRWRPDGIRGRDRGVSAVIGFVLIFGILVITFSLYQAQVVPQQNSEVEFEQHQEIQQQMVELRSNIVSMQGSASTLSSTVDLGVRYPSRTIFVNPGPARGSLRTEGAGNPNVNFTLRNVTATDSDGTGDFWNGTKLNYSTSIIEYEPDYNRFQGGLPVVYEHSLIYNRVENGNSVPITDQSLINDNRINLIALNGTLAESGVGAESVDLEPVSTRTRVVEVNNKSGPITLEFASMLNASVWNETLENEQYVESVSRNGDAPGEFSILELKLEPNRDYELKLSKVGLGTGATDTTAEYLTEVEGAGATVLNDSTQKLTVEARDQFNGPQSGVTVNASAEEGTVNDNRTTDSEGQATFIYRPNSLGDNDIEFSINSDGHDRSTPEDVTISVTVTSGSGGGGGGGSGGDGSTGVGQGGIESYSKENNSETFSAPNGRWVGITCTDQLNLSNGQPASRPNGNLQGDVIRFNGQFNDSTGDEYTIDVRLARKNDNSFNKKAVKIYDGTGNSQEIKLTPAAASKIYAGDEVDILNISNYQKGPGSSWSDTLKEIRDLESNKPVVWQTSRVTGRVDVALGCDASGGAPGAVSTVDGTTPDNGDSALRFDIQAPSGTTKTVVNLTTTTPGNSNSNVNNERLKRNSGEEIYLNVSDTTGNDGGHEQNNLKLDGTTYDLDKGNKGTNAIFSDGATLSVNMGELDSGNTQWTYDLVGSESSADVVVTFGFEDGSQFQAYLQVTNVNN